MRHTYERCEWDEDNIYKNEIKHYVPAREIEECFQNISVIIPHKKYKDRKVMLGVTKGGRYLFIIFQHKSKTLARPISARDMNEKERRIYKKQIGYE